MQQVLEKITGNITVHSPPVLELSSAATTTNQIGFFAVCDRQDDIADIVYSFYGGATDVAFKKSGSVGSPNTIEPVLSPLHSTSNTKKS